MVLYAAYRYLPLANAALFSVASVCLSVRLSVCLPACTAVSFESLDLESSCWYTGTSCSKYLRQVRTSWLSVKIKATEAKKRVCVSRSRNRGWSHFDCLKTIFESCVNQLGEVNITRSFAIAKRTARRSCLVDLVHCQHCFLRHLG